MHTYPWITNLKRTRIAEESVQAWNLLYLDFLAHFCIAKDFFSCHIFFQDFVFILFSHSCHLMLFHFQKNVKQHGKSSSRKMKIVSKSQTKLIKKVSHPNSCRFSSLSWSWKVHVDWNRILFAFRIPTSCLGQQPRREMRRSNPHGNWLHRKLSELIK